MRAGSSIVIGLLLCLFTRSGNTTEPPSDAAPNRHALLVGCTRYASLPKERWLEGPGNDVTLMRTLLIERFHFPSANIVTLSDRAGQEAERPTREAIRRELARLAQVARAGDRVVVLLAGHGSQQPDQDPPDPKDPEPDGLDEIFLPADIGAWDRNRQVVTNAIVDDELRDWLKAIQDKGALVWAIIDACHSGTMVRGSGEQVLREVPAESLVPQAALDEAQRRAAPQAVKTRGTSDELGDELAISSPGLVALYAAQPEEPAVEMKLPRGSAARKYQGLLTYVVCQVLTEAKSRLTYRQLAQRVHNQYTSWGFSFPTPLLEGKDLDHFILETTQEPEPAHITLSRQDSAWRIDAGALQGVTPGSILAVYPRPGSAKADEVVGHVRILAEDFRTLEARVEPCAFRKMGKPADLPDGGQCRPASIDYGDLRIKVAVDPVVGIESAQARHSPAALGEADQRRLSELVKKLEGESAPLLKAAAAAEADWLVRAAAQGAEKVYLVPASGWLVQGSAQQLPPLFGPLEPNVDTLKERLGRIARAQNLLKLTGDSGGEALFGDSELGVKVDLLRFANEADRVGKALTWQGQKIDFREGEIVGFRVQNLGREPIDVTVLFVDSGFGITPFIPRSAGADNRLPPARGAPERPPLTRRFRVTAKTVGPEHLVVIAVKAKPEDQPADFSFLAQDSIPRARGVAGLRGNEKQTIDSPLGRLFQNALFGEGSTRGASSLDIDEYSLGLVTWKTLAR